MAKTKLHVSLAALLLLGSANAFARKQQEGTADYFQWKNKINGLDLTPQEMPLIHDDPVQAQATWEKLFLKYMENLSSRSDNRMKSFDQAGINYQDLIFARRKFGRIYAHEKTDKAPVKPMVIRFKEKSKFCVDKKSYQNYNVAGKDDGRRTYDFGKRFSFESKADYFSKSSAKGVNEAKNVMVKCMMALIQEGFKVHIHPQKINSSKTPEVKIGNEVVKVAGNWDDITLSELIRVAHMGRSFGYPSVGVWTSAEYLQQMALFTPAILNVKGLSLKEYLEYTEKMTAISAGTATDRVVPNSFVYKMLKKGKYVKVNMPLSQLNFLTYLLNEGRHGVNLNVGPEAFEKSFLAKPLPEAVVKANRNTRKKFLENQVMAMAVIDEIRLRSEMLIGAGAKFHVLHNMGKVRGDLLLNGEGLESDWTKRMTLKYLWTRQVSRRFFEFDYITGIGIRNKTAQMGHARKWDYSRNMPTGTVKVSKFRDNRITDWFFKRGSKGRNALSKYEFSLDPWYRTHPSQVTAKISQLGGLLKNIVAGKKVETTKVRNFALTQFRGNLMVFSKLLKNRDGLKVAQRQRDLGTTDLYGLFRNLKFLGENVTNSRELYKYGILPRYK